MHEIANSLVGGKTSRKHSEQFHTALMNAIMKENEARHYRIELSKIQMKAYIVFLLLLSEEEEHSFTRRRGITDPPFGSQRSFKMTLKKHV